MSKSQENSLKNFLPFVWCLFCIGWSRTYAKPQELVENIIVDRYQFKRKNSTTLCYVTNAGAQKIFCRYIHTYIYNENCLFRGENFLTVP